MARALLGSAATLSGVRPAIDDQIIGVETVRRALRTPLRTIAAGAGVGAPLAAAEGAICKLSKDDKADAAPSGVDDMDGMDGMRVARVRWDTCAGHMDLFPCRYDQDCDTASRSPAGVRDVRLASVSQDRLLRPCLRRSYE